MCEKIREGKVLSPPSDGDIDESYPKDWKPVKKTKKKKRSPKAKVCKTCGQDILSNEIHNIVLPFNLPTKEILWITRKRRTDTDTIDKFTDFTDGTINMTNKAQFKINSKNRVVIQGAIQKYIDHSISSTINLAEDVEPEVISDIYFMAWQKKLKGVTIYRDGSRFPILSTDGELTEFQTVKDKEFSITIDDDQVITANGEEIIETLEERIQRMVLLRELQDEAPGFFAFIPLEYQVGNTKLVPQQASAIDDLKTIATSRLMLDNFPHIKAYWVMLGEETASISLNFGASDMDGTIGEERIAHAAKAASPVGLARNRMLRLIGDAGKIPVERDALYNEIHVYDN